MTVLQYNKMAKIIAICRLFRIILMITSLHQLVTHFENKANTSGTASIYAIVTDATFPLFRPVTNDYITQVTFIDRTLPKSKYTVKAYLISPRSHQIMMNCIGQVIHLSVFQFAIRGDYYIQGRPNSDSKVGKCTNINSSMITQESNATSSKFQSDRAWFLDNFEELYKPEIGLGRYILNEKTLVSNSFNMILRVKERMASNSTCNSKSINNYKLLDNCNNEFTIQFPAVFEPNTYVVIKNISHVENNLYIILEPISNLMILPKPMKYSYKTISSNKEEYNHPTLLTSLKCSLLIEEESISPLRELALKIQDYQRGNKMIKEDHQAFFTKDRQVFLQEQVIRVYILAVSGSIRLFNGTFFVDETEINREKLGLSNFTSKWNKRLWYVYNMTFWVKDASVEESDELFPIYLFDFDGNGSDFFPNISLSQMNRLISKKIEQKFMVIQLDEKSNGDNQKVSYALNEKQIHSVMAEKRKVEDKINEWIDKLYTRTDPLQLMTIVVEPLIDKFEMRYRISNTKLNQF